MIPIVAIALAALVSLGLAATSRHDASCRADAIVPGDDGAA